MGPMRIFLSLLAALGFWNAMTCHGEDANPKDEKGAPTTNAKTWAGLEVDGLILDLQDDKHVLWLSFHRDGYVAVTAGLKDGGVTAPLCYWKVNGEWMQISDDEKTDAKPWFQMRVLKRTDKTLTVENATGEKQVFAIKMR